MNEAGGLGSRGLYSSIVTVAVATATACLLRDKAHFLEVAIRSNNCPQPVFRGLVATIGIGMVDLDERLIRTLDLFGFRRTDNPQSFERPTILLMERLDPLGDRLLGLAMTIFGKHAERIAEPVVAARLVSSSASSTRRFAVLNAGSWQGVAPGQPVRGPEGLIGRVLETGPNSARVLLLTDPESVVPVRRTRDGMPALAAGRGDGLLDVKSVALATTDFGPGDVFITSGTGGIYPPNIPVARIIRRGRDAAIGRSFAQPDTVDYALVQRAFMPAPPPVPSPTPSPSPPARKPTP